MNFFMINDFSEDSQCVALEYLASGGKLFRPLQTVVTQSLHLIFLRTYS
jgi:hypothetical protein